MLANGKLYERGWLEVSELAALQASFGRLPADTYAEERLRSRRYSRYSYKNGVLTHMPHKDFMQSSEINKYVGDVERRYEELEPELEKDPAFLDMFKEFQERTNLAPGSVIEVHQIRWHCKRRIKEPAPEGMHQDGFDYIAMFMVGSHNVDGGDFLLYESPEDAPCFKAKLEPGEFLILNDKKMFHNAAPLVPTPNKDDGHWDVMVLTANNAA